MTQATVDPIAGQERIALLDVLRGAAIFGILIANMLGTSGYWFLSPAERAALPTAGLDGPVEFLIHVLLEAKFYSIFSLLFGIGFAVQWRRAEAKGLAFPVLFRRRLLGLALIGFVHAVFIWAGDILFLYALLGFLLVPFHRVSDRAVLRAAIICLALPVVVYLLMLAARVGAPFAAASETPGEVPPIFQMALDGFQGDSWFAAWRANLIFLMGRWMDLFVSMRFPKVFGMFLLGLYIGRTGIGLDPGRDGGLLRRLATLGLVIGIPANLLMAWLQAQQVYLPASGLGLLQVVAASIGVPVLALGYAALLALAFHGIGHRVLAPLGWAGRMALTNYLTHSILMVSLFYGIGLGLFGRVGPAGTTVISLLICLLQVPLSALWLSRFQFGPVEWLWRQFTYRRRMTLRRAPALA